MIDGETIKESLSYELLMQLAIMQHDIIQTASKHEALMAQLSAKSTSNPDDVKLRKGSTRGKVSVGTPGS